jgi:hypothetical protein
MIAASNLIPTKRDRLLNISQKAIASQPFE